MGPMGPFWGFLGAREGPHGPPWAPWAPWAPRAQGPSIFRRNLPEKCVFLQESGPFSGETSQKNVFFCRKWAPGPRALPFSGETSQKNRPQAPLGPHGPPWAPGGWDFQVLLIAVRRSLQGHFFPPKKGHFFPPPEF